MVLRYDMTRRFRRGRRQRGGGIVLAVLALLLSPAAADAVNGWLKADESCRVVRVIDGDTLSIRCWGDPVDRLRLTDVDTPEIRGKCLSERWLAIRAMFFTRWQLLKAGEVTIERSGNTGRYGRALGDVALDGDPLGAGLLAAGLARPYVSGGHDWCERVSDAR